ncbi:MAG: substrate-binding domain-containing protein [Anaerolineae bacterium]|nr:substrate-binding domain-containing protein [Anaerolineae bacterium]MDW8101106.1 substrate-binding domain-containing protein [Anaerolineae bacterium]
MLTDRLSRREFLKVASAAAMGSMLAACVPPATPAPVPEKPAAAPTPAPAQPLTVNFWTFWGGFEEMHDEWKATEPYKKFIDGNNLVLNLTSNVGLEAFLANIAAGTPPDVGVIWIYLDLMARGVVIPIDDLVAASSLKPEEFIEGNWKFGSYKGKQYGVPALEAFVRRGLNYNARMVAEAGLDPDNPPATWTEALEWHRKLTKFDQAGNLLQIGLDPYDAEGMVWSGDGFLISESWGFDWFDENTGKFNVDNEKMAEGLEVLGEFVRIIGPDNLDGMRAVEGQGTWGGAYNAEVQAMIIEGYWHPGETAIEKPEVSKVNRATWVPVPESRRGVKFQFAGGHLLLFFKDAPHPREAFPVAEFLNTQEACEIIFRRNGWLPAWKPYLETVDPSIYPGLEFYFNSVKEANEWWHAEPCELSADFLQTKFAEIREAVYRNEMTGAEGAAKLQKLLEEEYKAAGFASS